MFERSLQGTGQWLGFEAHGEKLLVGANEFVASHRSVLVQYKTLASLDVIEHIHSLFIGGSMSKKAQYFVLRPDQREPALNVIGTKVTVLAPNATTQSYGITFQQGDEGTGPPPHSHHWDESFYVLKGEIEFLCDGKSQACKSGTLVHVPGGTVHGFRFGKSGGEMLEISGQDALAAQMFTAINNEIPVGPPDFPKVLEVLKRHGVTVAA